MRRLGAVRCTEGLDEIRERWWVSAAKPLPRRVKLRKRGAEPPAPVRRAAWTDPEPRRAPCSGRRSQRHHPGLPERRSWQTIGGPDIPCQFERLGRIGRCDRRAPDTDLENPGPSNPKRSVTMIKNFAIARLRHSISLARSSEAEAVATETPTRRTRMLPTKTDFSRRLTNPTNAPRRLAKRTSRSSPRSKRRSGPR